MSILPGSRSSTASRVGFVVSSFVCLALAMAGCGGSQGVPAGGGGHAAIETSAKGPPSSTLVLHINPASNQPPTTCAAAQTCNQAGANCGQIGDGCGNILDCGDSCPSGQTCGGGGVPSLCGAPQCTPTTCVAAGANCGSIADGCGGLLECGGCTGGDTCGGGGTPSVCGHGSKCTPKTCAQVNVGCDMTGDGCGGELDCGGCPSGQSCGGGGVPSVCGAPKCTPLTCSAAGADCGSTADGCGGIIPCGTCSLPTTCGGGGTINVCGVPGTCTNLCLQQVSCPDPTVTTTVSGVVYAPNGLDPLVNALVYVPNAPVEAFSPQVSCDNCGEAASGSPLVTAVSAVDGSFTLKNVPVGSDIPLVIQIGRWRRQVTLPVVSACQDNPADPDLTRFPRNQTEGDIPLMAFSTGYVDALECVMRKIGIDDSEFTGPNGGGRINLYVGIGSGLTSTTAGPAQKGGAQAPDQYVTEDQLWSNVLTLKNYDMVLFACQGWSIDRTSALPNIVDYTSAGGRLYVTHLGAAWLDGTKFLRVDRRVGREPQRHPPQSDGVHQHDLPQGHGPRRVASKHRPEPAPWADPHLCRAPGPGWRRPAVPDLDDRRQPLGRHALHLQYTPWCGHIGPMRPGALRRLPRRGRESHGRLRRNQRHDLPR